jgi:hypothetical protein
MPAFLIPLIIAAVGAGASYLKQRAANKSAEEQKNLYNQWVINRQNGVNDLIERLTAGGNDPYGPQVSTSTGRSSSTTLQEALTTTSQRPVITDQFKPLVTSATNVAQSRLNRPSALPPGFIERAVAGINQSYAGANAAARNAAARKGLSGVQTFGLASPIESSRAGKIGDFLAEVPLKERQLQNEDVSLASELARTFGLGSDSVSRTTGKSSTSGQTSNTLTQPPNMGSLAALLLPPGPYGGPGPGSALGTAGVDLASLLATLWAGGAFKSSGVSNPAMNQAQFDYWLGPK